ncbi:transposase [Pseudarthrobacter sp. YS3]|uniref:transposase n=1 Tax=Pseudarthrobacter sp. YS3 TaxID=3453718 RepID=UPI003EEB4203
MQALGLVCKVRRRKRYNSYKGEQGAVAANVLNREFEADAPNRKWFTDVTEFSVGNGKLYLSPVMDLFDRQIISHTVGLSPNLALTNDFLRGALTCLQPGQQPLVHSDQGFQDGFNRSSQHLDFGRSYGQASRLDESGDGQACHEIAGEAVIKARIRAGVLA